MQAMLWAVGTGPSWTVANGGYSLLPAGGPDGIEPNAELRVFAIIAYTQGKGTVTKHYRVEGALDSRLEVCAQALALPSGLRHTISVFPRL